MSVSKKKSLEDQVDSQQAVIVKLRAELEKLKGGVLDRSLSVIVNDGDKGFHKLTIDYSVETGAAKIVAVAPVQSEIYRAAYEAKKLTDENLKDRRK